jgi:hypothetical protein
MGNLIARRLDRCKLQTEQKEGLTMADLFLLIAAVPAIALSVWSDVGSVHEAIEKRKLDASNLSLPGDYHTLYD